jgi:hypothetical protein
MNNELHFNVQESYEKYTYTVYTFKTNFRETGRQVVYQIEFKI